ncbi:dTDP-4-dehydrorhamnose reductase [Chitiniphilus eburneus]|uniref:dTDP-4-dehydrorhamnose reductase n=1 Tax=Chitiniphilus eburneus TaxID=2571148 RepID=A0A4U0QMG2_9NEIS|nr:dTDP-4-dehydrorhamnose reductase [Chitiniphilus eburneus]TJZ77274.1 dTDP-4-dehydrorhamnose reductase [Chitiniphilus eburneus]
MTLPVILITGKRGQVGFELERSLAVLGHVVAVGRDECDLTNTNAIFSLLERIQPNVIVNPAAYTAVDKAETEVELATQLNATTPAALAQWTAANDALLVHYSTDYVFDGRKSGWYSEDDTPYPQSIYGKTKLAGENAIQASNCRHLILRTAWVYGVHGDNFLKTMLRLMKEREALSIVADQIGSPTSAALLADLTAQLVAMYWRTANRASFAFGTYHAVAEGETSWHEYAQTINRLATQMGWAFRVTADAITPIPAHNYPTSTQRPANSRLATTKLRTSFNLTLPPWQQGVKQVLTQLRAGAQQ